MRTADWVRLQPDVQSVETLDSTYIKIVMKSGLTTIFSFNQRDADSMSISRGGSRSGSRLVKSATSSKNTISNKKVLIFAAAYSEFYGSGEMQKLLDLFANSGLDFDVTLLTNEQCTYQAVDNFKNYGLVIIDSHGIPDAFLLGTILRYAIAPLSENEFKNITDAQLGFGAYDKLLTGQLNFGSRIDINLLSKDWEKQKNIGKTTFYQIYLTSNYIKTLPAMPGTVIMGNMCYSGWSVPGFYKGASGRYYISDPIASTFLSKNPISYYGYANASGYSAGVDDGFSKRMEDSLIRALVIDLDSTGSAYRASNNTEFFDPSFTGKISGQLFFKHFGAFDYSYDSCGGKFTDERDGHVYKTVCIGKQQWMAQNLNYNAPGSICNVNNPANCDIYGRLYDWATIMQGATTSSATPSGVRGICPKGWHVPSRQEYFNLVNAVGGDAVSGKALKDTILWGSRGGTMIPATNSSGFSALPGGYGSPGASFDESGYTGFFWTTTENPQISTEANYLRIYASSDKTTFERSDKAMQNSCRCLKD